MNPSSSSGSSSQFSPLGQALSLKLDLGNEQDEQEQQDEMIALDAILGPDIQIMQSTDHPRIIQVMIQVEPPHLPIVIKNPNGDTFEVTFLPAFVFYAMLPPTYPSCNPPLFQIGCDWLNYSQLTRLCHKLDQIWAEMGGTPIVYTLVDWLKTSIWDELQLGSEISIIADDGMEPGVDSRAMLFQKDAEKKFFSLLMHNYKKTEEQFLESIQTCGVCFSDLPGTEFFRIQGCQHHFCKECVRLNCSTHIKLGTVFDIKCPDPGCGTDVIPAFFKDLITPEEYERWEHLLLQKTLESMTDATYCPRCQTMNIAEPDQISQCSKCFFTYCSLCLGSWHKGEECMSPDMKLNVLEARAKGQRIDDQYRKKLAEIQNERAFFGLVNKDSKRCPNCRQFVTKTYGCNKMTCICGIYFCYLCGNKIGGYEHFQGGKCILFEDVNPNPIRPVAFDRVARPGADMANALLEMEPPERIKKCPQCRCRIPKVGNNNHMRCWQCQVQFCFLCNEAIRGTEHFKPFACRQHS